MVITNIKRIAKKELAQALVLYWPQARVLYQCLVTAVT